MKFCKDCKFFNPKSLTCSHVLCVQVDLVTGENMELYCRKLRQNNFFRNGLMVLLPESDCPCGSTGKLFESI